MLVNLRKGMPMKFSVCLDILYGGGTQQQYMEGIKEVKRAGFDAIEFWSWWDKDMNAIIETAGELGLQIVSFCAKIYNLGMEENRAAFLGGLEESIHAAKLANAKYLIAQSGDELPGVSKEVFRNNLVETLRAAAPMLEKEDITLVLEPLNTLSSPGYWLSDSAEGFGIIDAVKSPNVKLLFDIFHQQITEGNIINNLTAGIEKIGHIHAAGAPARNEIFNGETNYDRVLNTVNDLGYTGYVGLEYVAHGETLNSLLRTRSYLEKCGLLSK